jgi:hypothetical protein
MRGTNWGKGIIDLQAAVPKRPHTRPLTLTLSRMEVLHLDIALMTKTSDVKLTYFVVCSLLYCCDG